MKKRIIALTFSLIVAFSFFSGCASDDKTLARLSETSDYIAMIDYKAIYGDEKIDLEELAFESIYKNEGTGSRRNFSLWQEKCENEFVYAVANYASSSVGTSGDFIKIDLKNKTVQKVFVDINNNLDVIFICGDYLYVGNGINYTTEYWLINKNDFSQISAPKKLSLSNDNKMYTKTEGANGVTVFNYEINNGALVESSQFEVLYKGYNEFEYFYVYDDCVVTDKFIYDIATKEYDFILFEHNLLNDDYYTRTHYLISEDENTITTSQEFSYVLLKDAKFVDLSESDLEDARVLTDASFEYDGNNFNGFELNFVGFNETVKKATLQKNSFVKALMRKSSLRTYKIIGDKIVVYACYDQQKSKENDNEETYKYSVFLFDQKTHESTVLGTFENMKNSFLNIYVWEVN